MNATSDTQQAALLNRREAIRRVGALLGGAAFVGGSGLIAAVENANAAAEPTTGVFSTQQIAFLDEIAETILPETKTPGAKAAHTGAFMARMVADCYAPAERNIFREGMRKVDDAMMKANSVSFMAATPAQRLALLGYFTSEIGCTQALRYVESPGRFDPCLPYSPGQPAWAAHA